MARPILKEKWCPGCKQTLLRKEFREQITAKGVTQIHVRCKNCEQSGNVAQRTVAAPVPVAQAQRGAPVRAFTAAVQEATHTIGRPRMTEKKCPNCNRVLRRSAFYEHTNRDGYTNISTYCKECYGTREVRKPGIKTKEAALLVISAWENWVPANSKTSQALETAINNLRASLGKK